MTKPSIAPAVLGLLCFAAAFFCLTAELAKQRPNTAPAHKQQAIVNRSLGRLKAQLATTNAQLAITNAQLSRLNVRVAKLEANAARAAQAHFTWPKVSVASPTRKPTGAKGIVTQLPSAMRRGRRADALKSPDKLTRFSKQSLPSIARPDGKWWYAWSRGSQPAVVLATFTLAPDKRQRLRTMKLRWVGGAFASKKPTAAAATRGLVEIRDLKAKRWARVAEVPAANEHTLIVTPPLNRYIGNDGAVQFLMSVKDAHAKANSIKIDFVALELKLDQPRAKPTPKPKVVPTPTN